ncbi:hypothetical protein E5S69_14745 [Cupriavidus necator]|uniref:hypothetical protein n=1 Tax=Cupriavidus necator TaxID=106590 RepID=UPI00148FBFF2|nr:hypothetical protein [Cupriavidus necator]NOV24765.1 hypothetical protein [Cupriavidus necator]
MPAWISAPVDIAGDAMLMEWRVMQTYSGTRHFVGSCRRSSGVYRVSPPIISFDAGTRVGLAKDGLRFGLTGFAGRDDGLWRLYWLIAMWNNKISGAKDVTGEYSSDET